MSFSWPPTYTFYSHDREGNRPSSEQARWLILADTRSEEWISYRRWHPRHSKTAIRSALAARVHTHRHRDCSLLRDHSFLSRDREVVSDQPSKQTLAPTHLYQMLNPSLNLPYSKLSFALRSKIIKNNAITLEPSNTLWAGGRSRV